MTKGAPRTEPDELQPLAVDTVTIVLLGTALFAAALVVTLLVPSLHSGDRDWWPWACVSGLGLGLIGLAYIRRGRGNAASARRPAGQAQSVATSSAEATTAPESAAAASDGRDTSTST